MNRSNAGTAVTSDLEDEQPAIPYFSGDGYGGDCDERSNLWSCYSMGIDLLSQKPPQLAQTAMAHKSVRIIWLVLSKNEYHHAHIA
ncbi:MAG: hypothetical protein R8G34_13870 [Paracoccaceae bacterium]|nr:hypothetical protein [Paracoccaceae bacterium]